MTVRPRALTLGPTRLGADFVRRRPVSDEEGGGCVDCEGSLIDEAYVRLHRTGPEFQGYLSNHGPMVAEAIVRHGHGDAVQHWLDGYVRRLEPFPRPMSPIGADWQSALGDVRRVGDWTVQFTADLHERPWRVVLNEWWPRLLPGIAAGATHGVIRVGHAVRSLLDDGETPARVEELGHGLAYWAARWLPVSSPDGGREPAADDGGVAWRSPGEALMRMPRIESADGDLREWVGRMTAVPGWGDAVLRVKIPDEPSAARDWLADLVQAAVVRYLTHGHGNPIMLVHSVTAPNAVWRTLPALDRRWWHPSAVAAWVAVSALTAIYAPPAPAEGSALGTLLPTGAGAADAAFARAVENGDEHVIKLADTAVEVFGRTADGRALAAIDRAARLIGS